MSTSQVDDHGHTVGVDLTDGQKRAAAENVASHSTDAEDCRLLLDMLGLLDTPIRSSRTVRNREHARASRARRKETT